MGAGVRITKAQFVNFKALKQFTLNVGNMNILVGPNNSGKSTLISAFRLLADAIRFARSKDPQRIIFDGEEILGFQLPRSSLSVSLENIRTELKSNTASVTFTLSNGNILHLAFSANDGNALIIQRHGRRVLTRADFRKEFPLSLHVVPVINQIEAEEQLVQRETVLTSIGTHRTSRHYRSYWYHLPDEFGRFAELLAKTWPGMQILRPELSGDLPPLVRMYCLEERITRELSWAGFGFQVWCQLLTHMTRAGDDSLIVIDEPEVYLHPDMQRRLLDVVRDIQADVVLATHSTEIMADAEPRELVVVDKNKLSAKRIIDVDGVQQALDMVGSVQNIHLTALARNRRILFVEDIDDFNILRKLAKLAGHVELSLGSGIAAMASGGLGSCGRVLALAEGMSEVLGKKKALLIGAVYDRDYFCTEDIEAREVKMKGSLDLIHFHRCKEIENHLLQAPPISRAIVAGVRDRFNRVADFEKVLGNVQKWIAIASDDAQINTQAQCIAKRNEFMKTVSRKNQSDHVKESLKLFKAAWDDGVKRLTIVPGKEVLAAVRVKIREEYGINITDFQIISKMNKGDLSEDLLTLLEKIEQFRVTPLQ